jgi:predicted Zn-dependent peptidase
VLGGDLITSLSTAPERATEAVRALSEQWERLRAEPIPDAELEPARRYLAGSFPQSASGVAGIGGLVSLAWIAGLPDDTWASYPGEVAAVDRQSAWAAVERWVRPQETLAVVVGPKEAALEAAAALGEPELGLAAEPAWEPRAPSV